MTRDELIQELETVLRDVFSAARRGLKQRGRDTDDLVAIATVATSGIDLIARQRLLSFGDNA